MISAGHRHFSYPSGKAFVPGFNLFYKFVFSDKRGLGRSPKRGEGGSPTLSPARTPGVYAKGLCKDAKPTKHTQPFMGKGFGDRDNELKIHFKITGFPFTINSIFIH